jgi:hypothetical protein
MRQGYSKCKSPPDRLIPKILFTGTTLSYLVREVKDSGRLGPGPTGKIYLTEDYFTASGFAHKRARQYCDEPVILAVNPLYLRDAPTGCSTGYSAGMLERGSFLPLEPVHPRTLDDHEAWEMVNGFPNAVTALRPESLALVVDTLCQTFLKQAQPPQPRYLVPKVPRRDP